jgi:hypothetical protein
MGWNGCWNVELAMVMNLKCEIWRMCGTCVEIVNNVKWSMWICGVEWVMNGSVDPAKFRVGKDSLLRWGPWVGLRRLLRLC